MNTPSRLDERIVVLAPSANDGLVTTRILGQWDRLEPGQPIVTNPRCAE